MKSQNNPQNHPPPNMIVPPRSGTLNPIVTCEYDRTYTAFFRRSMSCDSNKESKAGNL